ncbi:alpha-glucan phosphorylase, h isozyme [Nicotiana attenuata]|uniref:Alpha-glucan phosphorylase, h isozyme n=1 Tax=Nicotiana attenuata TaxID=49451 RepID=A0A314KQ63_NICAT|nr:alpha-glucan phosphorylase, h isozyme [Nicotiana attenuata]OIT34439.1 alpha-glucan phosphorylase, h isozyme [Nicotiana attenuata]
MNTMNHWRKVFQAKDSKVAPPAQRPPQAHDPVSLKHQHMHHGRLGFQWHWSKLFPGDTPWISSMFALD